MATLFKTLLEIVLLRKGPNDIPHSSVLFVLVTAIWFLLGVVTVMAIESYKSSSLLVDLLLALVGLAVYSFVVIAFGRSERLLRCLTAVFGCSIVISGVLLCGLLGLPSLLSEIEVQWVVRLIWLWSIPVEGHIIARTIERPWFFGFLIALALLYLQINLLDVLNSLIGSAA